MTIKKGTHAPWRLPVLLFGSPVLSFIVYFTRTCRYYIDTDQDDINKLFGIGYLTWKFIYMREFNLFGRKVKMPWFRSMHHVYSVRFGWRYNPTLSDSIEILAYWYDNGVRHSESMCYVNMSQMHTFEIDLFSDSHRLTIYNSFTGGNISKVIRFNKVRNSRTLYSYLLRQYFGGNRKAPHDIIIGLEKI